MVNAADAYHFQPQNVTEIGNVLELAKALDRPVVLRGSGRSYGDASILPEGISIDLTAMRQILAWDPDSGIVECEPGVTLEDLWRRCLPDGWWPPVVSGTMFVTLGGALAMNIHGKNNFRAGCLGEHVLEFDLMTSDGSVQAVSRGHDLFHLAISGAGLLGVITRIRLQMKRVASGQLSVYAESASNWDSQFKLFEQHRGSSDYMVSWVDCFARGAASGRGLFHAASHPQTPDPGSLRIEGQDLPSRILGVFPKSAVWRILRLLNNNGCMRFLNSAKHHSARMIGNRKTFQQSLVEFSFLLDYVPNWRNAYLPGGFVQYQSFIPHESARLVFENQIDLSQKAGLTPYLAVMKRHRPDTFVLSHGVDGYSLALDYKVTERSVTDLKKLGNRMNEIVLANGGKFYLAKDSLLSADEYAASMGDDLGRFKATKRILDPENLFQSQLARRLNLLPGNLNS